MAQHMTSGRQDHRHYHHHRRRRRRRRRCLGRRSVTTQSVALTPTSERVIHVSRTSQGHCRRRRVLGRCSETWRRLLLDVDSLNNDDQCLSSRRHRQLHVDVIMSTMILSITLHTNHFSDQFTICYCSSTLSLPPFCSLLLMSFAHFRL